MITWAQALVGAECPIFYNADGLLITKTNHGEVEVGVGSYVLYNGSDFYPATEQVVAELYYL